MYDDILVSTEQFDDALTEKAQATVRALWRQGSPSRGVAGVSSVAGSHIPV